MPASNVRLQAPLVRLKTLYPGQFGVAGSDVSLGLRLGTTGKVIYVDPNYIGVTDDSDGTDPECPLASIQAAVNKCTDFAGDVILVMHNDSWLFGPRTTARNTPIAENVIVNKHGISIVGVAQSSSVGVPWRPATAGGVACTVNALDVLIEGFAFCESLVGAGAGTGISVVWNGTTAWGDNFSVRHCYFGDDLDNGILLDYVWNSVFEDCEFQSMGAYGIYCDPAGSAPASLTIRRNWFYECGLGAGGAIYIPEANGCLIADNWVYNGNAQSAVAATNEGIYTGLGADNIVANNWLSCLRPVPANGDYDDFCSGSGSDAWLNCHCLDGDAVTTPT